MVLQIQNGAQVTLKDTSEERTAEFYAPDSVYGVMLQESAKGLVVESGFFDTYVSMYAPLTVMAVSLITLVQKFSAVKLY